MRVERHDPDSFCACAFAWLLRAEGEHSLLLGIVTELTRGKHRYEGAPYLATVHDGEAIVGCAFRTPPFKLGMTRMPPAAIMPVATDVAQVFATLSAVMGPPAETLAFGDAWCALRGGSAVPGMRQGIFELTAVSPPPQVSSGQMRIARPTELARLAHWCAEFAREAGTPIGDPANAAAYFIDRCEMSVWDHGGARSMAVATGPTPTGIRVGLVYTPPADRNRGYATSLVAELSAAQLAAGRRACFLYTDLANPTSNAIYERLGYRRVAEALDVEFREPEAPGVELRELSPRGVAPVDQER